MPALCCTSKRTAHFSPAMICAALICAVAFSTQGFADSTDEGKASQFRYAPKVGETYVYEVSLVIDGVDGERTQSGTMNYKPLESDEERIVFDFWGTFSSGWQYPSSKHTKFSMSPLGELQSLQRDIEMPALLGQLSNSVFIPFPDTSEKVTDNLRWVASGKVSLVHSSLKKLSLRTPLIPFSRYRPTLPFSPYGAPQETENRVTIADEETRFEASKNGQGGIVVESKYLLKSAKDIDGITTSVTGNGKWEFADESRMPSLVSIKRTITVASDKISVSLPVTFSAKLVPADVIAKRTEEAKKKREESLKAKRAPLTEEEKETLFADLKSGDFHRVNMALGKLSSKTPDKPDPEVVEALKTIDESLAGRLRSWIDRTTQAFSPKEERERLKLITDYNGHGTVPNSGLKIDEDTILKIGQIVQYRKHNSSPFWHAARIKALLEDGSIILVDNPPFNRTQEVSRDRIQLAPPEIPQPTLKTPPSSKPARKPKKADVNPSNWPKPSEKKPPVSENPFAPEQAFRTWTDSSGTHSIEAKIVAVKGTDVTLERRADGKQITLERSKLSQTDRLFLESYETASKKSPNPFEPQ